MMSKCVQIEEYQSKQFAYYLDKLKGVQEAGRTLLDNSVILFASSISDGHSHSRKNLPVVVFGSGDLPANSRIDQGNFAIFLNAVNWCVDRDRQLSIPPRPVERFQLSLSAADFARLRYALLLDRKSTRLNSSH